MIAVTVPITVIVTTYNEELHLGRCLQALQNFDEIIVLDSNSTDSTKDIARKHNARVENFTWDKLYPKKRQYCLNNIKTRHDYIFFVDADEMMLPALVAEISALDFTAAGYFVQGQYVWQGRILKQGLKNNKLCLFDKNKIEFPVVDDLDIEGMGEIEGHYQPVLKDVCKHEKIEQINAPLLHYAYEISGDWEARHQRYATWEAAMIKRDGYPKDPVVWREALKRVFRRLPCRGVIAFMHCYLYKFGFLDGKSGFDFAKSRARYYGFVAKRLSDQ